MNDFIIEVVDSDMYDERKLCNELDKLPLEVYVNGEKSGIYRLFVAVNLDGSLLIEYKKNYLNFSDVIISEKYTTDEDLSKCINKITSKLIEMNSEILNKTAMKITRCIEEALK